MWVKIDQHTQDPYSNTGGTPKRFGGPADAGDTYV